MSSNWWKAEVRPFTGKQRAQTAEQQESGAAQDLQTIGLGLWNATSSLRASTEQTLNQVLGGGRPENMRIFAPEREAVENQVRVARENILSTTPTRGGQLNQALTNVELARAGTLGQMEADIRRQAFREALGVGFQVPAAAIGAISRAGDIFGGQTNRGMQETFGKNRSIGSLAGMGFGK